MDKASTLQPHKTPFNKLTNYGEVTHRCWIEKRYPIHIWPKGLAMKCILSVPLLSKTTIIFSSQIDLSWFSYVMYIVSSIII